MAEGVIAEHKQEQCDALSLGNGCKLNVNIQLLETNDLLFCGILHGSFVVADIALLLMTWRTGSYSSLSFIYR